MANPSNHAAVYVERITLQDFRGISTCTLTLEPDLTLLVGRNNVGKSRLLRAIAVALGVPADRDDVTVGGSGTSMVDMVLAPIPSGGGEEIFSERERRRLALGVQPINEDPLRERFGWRTTIGPSLEGTGMRSDRVVMIFDAGSEDWQPSTVSLSPSQSALLSPSLVDTGRDLTEELGRRGSAIRRILDDLEVAPADRDAIERQMVEISRTIISSSASLTAVTEALATLTDAVSSVGSAQFSPLPNRLEELSRSISMTFDTGSGPLPVRLHGSGSRSLASLQVRNVMYDRRLGRDGSELRPQPVTLVEEPESHLHPQAQFELSELLSSLTGQAVVSTHSAHLVTVVEHRTLRLLQAGPGGLRVADFHPSETAGAVRARRPSFHSDEMEKLTRTIERPFGELLFASMIVIGDGATERALLPPLIRHVLGARAHGVTVVDPGSMSSADPVVKFAKFVEVPWMLFSDADPAGVSDARRLDSSHGGGDEATITWVGPPGGAIHALEDLLVEFDLDLCRAALDVLGTPLPTSADKPEVVKALTGKKGAVGRLLANELIRRHPDRARALDEEGYWPEPIRALLRKIATLLEGGADGHHAQS